MPADYLFTSFPDIPFLAVYWGLDEEKHYVGRRQNMVLEADIQCSPVNAVCSCANALRGLGVGKVLDSRS